MIRKIGIAWIFLLFISSSLTTGIAQHSVEAPVFAEDRIPTNVDKINSWLQKDVKTNLLNKLWQDPKNHQQLSIKNWYINPQNDKYQLDIVLQWNDRWSDSAMAIEGKLDFSFPSSGDAVFRVIGKTKNLIELEQIRGTKIPAKIALGG